MTTTEMKFLNYCNKRMVNQEMLQDLLPKVHYKKGERNVEELLKSMTYNYEQYVSSIEYTKEYGFVERIFAGRTSKKLGFVWQEIAVISETGLCVSRNCYYAWNNYASGFHVFGYDKKDKKVYSWYGNYSFEYTELFELTDLTSDRIPRQEMFGMEQIAALDESVKYCAWKWESGIHFIDYVKLYRVYPIAEMLMKLELFRMINEKALKKITDEKVFQKWLFKHAKEVHRMTYQTAHNAFKKQPDADARDYQTSLNYRIQCGKELASGNREAWNQMKKYVTQEKAFAYINQTGTDAGTYLDYLLAAEYLQLDMQDTKVLFPRNFNEVHDAYVEQYARHIQDAEILRQVDNARRDKERLKSLNQALSERASEFSFMKWNYDGYFVLIAESKEDLLKEGVQQKNCVGRMNYDQRMERGEEIICFIRKVSSPSCSYITASVDAKTMKIKQFYCKENRLPPKEMQEWRDKWEAHNKRALKKIKAEARKAA
ncbi:PcfJ domain-containing protein [Treponema sp.]|uniref:PcfJ domain-containing protein n=1 Tax=Treponema sp. TaxID=166 RepID=UPI00298DB350|nr:PcfJ domain-containing protein [Treponema sp.]MCQ2242105.1 PcfJ domain-containing protein [Treponema sp.]